MVRGRTQDNFGADSIRDDLFNRDINRSPFKKSTYVDAAAPGAYKTKEQFMKNQPTDVQIPHPVAGVQG